MLRSLHLRDFKAFADQSIPLSPMTALIGANGAGKSTVLQALGLFRALTSQTVAQYLETEEWDFDDLPHLRTQSKSFEIAARVELNGASADWSLVLRNGKPPGIEAETVRRFAAGSLVGGTGEAILDRHGDLIERLDESSGESEEIRLALPMSVMGSVDPEDLLSPAHPTLRALRRWADGIRPYLFLDPRKMRTSSRGATDDIGTSGDDLASFVHHLRRNREVGFQSLLRRVQRYYPRLSDIETSQRGPGWTTLEVRERWGESEATFNARQVSDGLLRLIAIAAFHELPRPPSLILLDEFENGLHPHLVGAVVEMLQELVDSSDGRTQVVFTTHSPLTLNHIRDGSQVLVVHRRPEEGTAMVTPLDETRGFDELRNAFDLGELWYNVGEEQLLSPEGEDV